MVEDVPGLAAAVYESLCLSAKEYAPIQELQVLVEGQPYDCGVEMPLYANEFR